MLSTTSNEWKFKINRDLITRIEGKSQVCEVLAEVRVLHAFHVQQLIRHKSRLVLRKNQKVGYCTFSFSFLIICLLILLSLIYIFASVSIGPRDKNALNCVSRD